MIHLLKKIFLTMSLTLSGSAIGQSAAQFIQEAREELAQKTAANVAGWHLDAAERWAADLDKGTITFEFKDGTRARAAVQVVGTYNTEDGSFLWRWDHPSIPETARQHARLARQWGEKNELANFQMRKVTCTEYEAWGFAAVASRLGNAQGVYRGPNRKVLVFMTFDDVSIEAAKR